MADCTIRRHLRSSQLFVIPPLSCLVMIPPLSSPPTCVLACQERAWVADSGAEENDHCRIARCGSLLPERRLPAARVLWLVGVTPL